MLNSLRCTYSKTHYFRCVLYSSQPQHENAKTIAKVVNVAIIGAPNSGKSTLINNIVERKVSLKVKATL